MISYTEETYERPNGEDLIVFQDHWFGHQKPGEPEYQVPQFPVVRSTATMTVEIRLVNPKALRLLYGHLPGLTGVAIRSINLNPSGPTVTLRVDLPSFPESAPQEWLDSGMDAVQCQLAFPDVTEVSLTRWEPPTKGDVRMEPYGDERRVRVAVEGSGVELEFACHEFATLSHVSAFKARPDGTDSGAHRYVSKVDARLYESLPGTEEYTFYGR
jgi:hypothetical protein